MTIALIIVSIIAAIAIGILVFAGVVTYRDFKKFYENF